MLVKFNDPGEFVEELKKDVELVDRRLVRITGLYRQVMGPAVRDYSVVATARVGSDLYRLEKYIGQLWGLKAEDDKLVLRKGEEVKDQLDLACVELGLSVRAGLLEDAKEGR